MKRIQRKRTKGYNMQEESRKLNGRKCIYVGRGSKWGNPFKVGTYPNAYGKAMIATIITKKPDEIRKLYKSGIFNEAITLENSLKWYELYLKSDYFKHDISELKGYNLSCFCPLDKGCHVDILLKIIKTE